MRGAHWTRTLYGGPSSGISDMVRVPDRPATLFAGMYQVRRRPWMLTSGGPGGGLYRSDDGGTTWRKVENHGLPSGLTGRIGVAAARGGRIYAIVQSKHGDLWRSDDGGASWTLMPHSPYVGARPFYFSRIFVDPANRDRVICVSLILSLSTDGGKTFKPISTNAGWDYHVAWWSHDGRRIAVGTDEGAIFSGDGGGAFLAAVRSSVFASLPRRLRQHGTGLRRMHRFAGQQLVVRTVGGEQRHRCDQPRLVRRRSRRRHVGARRSHRSEPHLDHVHQQRHRTSLSVESPHATGRRSVALRAQQRRGAGDIEIPIQLGHADCVHNRARDGGRARRRQRRVRKSRTADRIGARMSPDLTRNEPSHQTASGGPIDLDVSGAETSDTILDIETTALDPMTIWVGTDDGLVQVTREPRRDWSNVTPAGAPQWCRVSTVEPGHFNVCDCVRGRRLPSRRRQSSARLSHRRRRCDVAVDRRRICRRTSSCVRCVKTGTIAICCLPERSAASSFRSIAAASWQSLRLNMPASAIYDLETVPQTDDLLVASHGRGVWILDDLAPLRGLPAARASATATMFALRTAYLMWQWAPINSFEGGTLPDNEFVGENPEYGALISYYLPKPAARRPAIDVVDGKRPRRAPLERRRRPERSGHQSHELGSG